MCKFVFPVFKSEDKYDRKNYRPITVLIIIDKVFESLLAREITEVCLRRRKTDSELWRYVQNVSTQCMMGIAENIAQRVFQKDETRLTGIASSSFDVNIDGAENRRLN